MFETLYNMDAIKIKFYADISHAVLHLKCTVINGLQLSLYVSVTNSEITRLFTTNQASITSSHSEETSLTTADYTDDARVLLLQ